jgi:hypothetical protein
VLYPDRELPSFLDKNRLPPDMQERCPRAFALIRDLLAAGLDDLVVADADGTLRFHADLRNAGELARRIDALSTTAFATRATAGRAELLALYEEVFDHAAFTGRSGTFFGYEGLGCIYWHMVSKLALAVQESLWRARDAGAKSAVLDALLAHYREIRAGLGIHASPADWGAFPIDAYSHTPRGGGARQPGMTGQVKEDVLRRFGELGVRIRDGRVCFDALLLAPSMATRTAPAPDLFALPGITNAENAGFRFTLCGSPIRIERGDADGIEIEHADGRRAAVAGLAMDPKSSHALLHRTGELRAIRVRFARKR